MTKQGYHTININLTDFAYNMVMFRKALVEQDYVKADQYQHLMLNQLGV